MRCFELLGENCARREFERPVASIIKVGLELQSLIDVQRSHDLLVRYVRLGIRFKVRVLSETHRWKVEDNRTPVRPENTLLTPCKYDR